jgi:hypothetical protein
MRDLDRDLEKLRVVYRYALRLLHRHLKMELDDFERLERSIKAHARLLIRQVLIACVVTLGWYVIFWRHHVHVAHDDHEVFLVGVMFLSLAVWILKAQEAFKVVWEQMREMSSAVDDGDEATIMHLRDERIHTLVHVMLAVYATLSVVLFCSYPYSSAASGFVAVFVVSLIFTLYWAVILTLENAIGVLWIKEQVKLLNPHLLTVDRDVFFACYRRCPKAERDDFHFSPEMLKNIPAPAQGNGADAPH